MDQVVSLNIFTLRVYVKGIFMFGEHRMRKSPWLHLGKDISNESVNILVYRFDYKGPPFVYMLETYIGFQSKKK